MPLAPANATPIHVLFALLPDSLALDWAGPAEALRMANQVLLAQGQPARFVLRFIGPEPETLSSVGLKLAGLEPLPATLPAPAWLVLVGQPGATIPVQSEATQALLHWLRGLRLKTGQLELVTICAGAVLAARAGLLAGRHVTRLFMLHADIAPLQYLRRIRLAVAQTALQSGRNVTQAAAAAGFSSDTQLRRAWHQLGQGGTPSASKSL